MTTSAVITRTVRFDMIWVTGVGDLVTANANSFFRILKAVMFSCGVFPPQHDITTWCIICQTIPIEQSLWYGIVQCKLIHHTIVVYSISYLYTQLTNLLYWSWLNGIVMLTDGVCCNYTSLIDNKFWSFVVSSEHHGMTIYHESEKQSVPDGCNSNYY